MIVTIEKFTTANCVWCCAKNVEGVEVRFEDGLNGFICKRDFWAALKARAQEPRPRQQSPAGEGS